MSNEPARFKDDKIKKMLKHLHLKKKITPEGEEVLLGVLHRLNQNGIWRKELHQELFELRKTYQISEQGMQAVEEAVFGD